jgi:primosomal protein N' (replication factor Y)
MPESPTTETAAGSVAVLLPLPLPRTLSGSYDYAVPAGMRVAPGDVVRVPLGRRESLGVVWGPAEGVAAGRLKPIAELVAVQALSELTRRFVDWVAGYTLAPPGAVLRMALSVPAALQPEVPPPLLRRSAEPLPEKLTAARRRLLDHAADGFARPASELAREAGVGPAVVKGLLQAGLLEQVRLPLRPPPQPDPERPGPALSPAQDRAAAALVRAAADGGFSATLLDGVTGSGKTEVYLEAVVAALRQGRQVLVLLPEIALSAQWLGRFAERFGAPPAVWHSEIGGLLRRRTWRQIAAGQARVVVGARSALFLPFRDLGLIVVDEEHEAAFKQEDGVIYHARDMAVVRAHLGQIPIALVSATPSLETLANVEAGRYAALRLPERHGLATLPETTLVDLRRHPPPRVPGLGQSWLAPPLRQALAETLGAGEQALLFLNRRGYAPLTLCRACGHRLQCPNCTAWLVEHRLQGRLQCHHCGYQARLPKACPACAAEDSFAPCGPGVERLAEELRALFPQARQAILSSDLIAGPSQAEALIGRIERREIDLLIGTQIVAKGHHFPHLTLVGVVDGDLGLVGGDLRAGERTFQLLSQVSGRAGRAEAPGRVLIQTSDPGHPVMQALRRQDRAAFLAAERATRQAGGWPPYGRLVALVVAAPDAARADAAAAALARAQPRERAMTVLGPAPAPLAVLRGWHRRRFLLKTPKDLLPQPLVRAWLAQVKLPSAVRVQVDVDPYSFL